MSHHDHDSDKKERCCKRKCHHRRKQDKCKTKCTKLVCGNLKVTHDAYVERSLDVKKNLTVKQNTVLGTEPVKQEGSINFRGVSCQSFQFEVNEKCMKKTLKVSWDNPNLELDISVYPPETEVPDCDECPLNLGVATTLTDIPNSLIYDGRTVQNNTLLFLDLENPLNPPYSIPMVTNAQFGESFPVFGNSTMDECGSVYAIMEDESTSIEFTDALFKLNPSTGKWDDVGTLLPNMSGLQFDENYTLYTSDGTGDEPGNLYIIDREGQVLETVGPLQTPEGEGFKIRSLARSDREGYLFGITSRFTTPTDKRFNVCYINKQTAEIEFLPNQIGPAFIFNRFDRTNEMDLVFIDGKLYLTIFRAAVGAFIFEIIIDENVPNQGESVPIPGIPIPGSDIPFTIPSFVYPGPGVSYGPVPLLAPLHSTDTKFNAREQCLTFKPKKCGTWTAVVSGRPADLRNQENLVTDFVLESCYTQVCVLGDQFNKEDLVVDGNVCLNSLVEGPPPFPCGLDEEGFAVDWSLSPAYELPNPFIVTNDYLSEIPNGPVDQSYTDWLLGQQIDTIFGPPPLASGQLAASGLTTPHFLRTDLAPGSNNVGSLFSDNQNKVVYAITYLYNLTTENLDLDLVFNTEGPYDLLLNGSSISSNNSSGSFVVPVSLVPERNCLVLKIFNTNSNLGFDLSVQKNEEIFTNGLELQVSADPMFVYNYETKTVLKLVEENLIRNPGFENEPNGVDWDNFPGNTPPVSDLVITGPPGDARTGDKYVGIEGSDLRNFDGSWVLAVNQSNDTPLQYLSDRYVIRTTVRARLDSENPLTLNQEALVNTSQRSDIPFTKVTSVPVLNKDSQTGIWLTLLSQQEVDPERTRIVVDLQLEQIPSSEPRIDTGIVCYDDVVIEIFEKVIVDRELIVTETTIKGPTCINNTLTVKEDACFQENIIVKGCIDNLEFKLLKDCYIPNIVDFIDRSDTSALGIYYSVITPINESFETVLDKAGTEIYTGDVYGIGNVNDKIYGYAGNQMLDLEGAQAKSYTDELENVLISYHGFDEEVLPFTDLQAVKTCMDTTVSYFYNRCFNLAGGGTDRFEEYQNMFLEISDSRFLSLDFDSLSNPTHVDVIPFASPDPPPLGSFVIGLYEPDIQNRQTGVAYPVRVPITEDFKFFNQVYGKEPYAYLDRNRKLTINIPEIEGVSYETLFVEESPCIDITYRYSLLSFSGTFSFMKQYNDVVLESALNNSDYIVQSSNNVNVKLLYVDPNDQEMLQLNDYPIFRNTGNYDGFTLVKLGRNNRGYDVIARKNLFNSGLNGGLQIVEYPDTTVGNDATSTLIQSRYFSSYLMLSGDFISRLDGVVYPGELGRKIIQGQTYPEDNGNLPPYSIASDDQKLQKIFSHEYMHAASRNYMGYTPSEGICTVVEMDPAANGNQFASGRGNQYGRYVRRLYNAEASMGSSRIPGIGDDTFGQAIMWNYYATQFDANLQMLRRSLDIVTQQLSLIDSTIPINSSQVFSLNPTGFNNAVKTAMTEISSVDLKDAWSNFCIASVWLRNNTSIPIPYRVFYPYWLFSDTNPDYDNVGWNGNRFWDNVTLNRVGFFPILNRPLNINRRMQDLTMVAYEIDINNVTEVTVDVVSGEYDVSITQFESTGDAVGLWTLKPDGGPVTLLANDSVTIPVNNVEFPSGGRLRLVCCNKFITAGDGTIDDYCGEPPISGEIDITVN